MPTTMQSIRDRFLPMAEIAAEQYAGRVPAGYPLVVDDIERGTIGLEIDPNFALYLSEEGNDLVADMYRRNPRTDARATAGRQKYAGEPLSDHRTLSVDISDEELRNLIGELKNAFNTQPGIIYITED